MTTLSAYNAWCSNALGRVVKASGISLDSFLVAELGNEKSLILEQWQDRLRRLNEKCGSPETQAALDRKVKEAGGNQWSGAIAELIAYDFFCGFSKLKAEVPPKVATLGERYANKKTKTLDGQLVTCGDWQFDVKRLAVPTRDGLQKLSRYVRTKHPGLRLTAEYPLDRSGDVIESRFPELKRRIDIALRNGAFPAHIVDDEILMKIYKPSGAASSTVHSYDPFRQAQEFESWAISDAHQLLVDAPNLRVFVVHPWFNIALSSDFAQLRTTFFRALARRVFMHSTKNRKPHKEIPALRVSGAAKRISAMLFLVDTIPERSAKKNHTREIDASFFVNPNTFKKNDASDYEADRFVIDAGRRLSLVERFKFDNY